MNPDRLVLPGAPLVDLCSPYRTSVHQATTISHVHIADLEKGLASWDELSFHRIRGLARAFGISPAKLIETIEGRLIDSYEDARLYRLPMVVESAGLPVWGGDKKGTIVVALPDIDLRDDSQIFAVCMRDDAMAPYARKGSVVVFDAEDQPQIGAVVALAIPGQGLIVRRYQGFSEAGRYLVTADGDARSVTETPRNTKLYGIAVCTVHGGS